MNLLLKLKDFLTSYIKEIRRPFDLLDIISILLLSLSSIGLLSLKFSVFNPILVIILSLISSILFIYIFSNSIVINKPGRKDIPILLILAIALFFRINPSLYLSGGQDQGLYISMSKSFEIEGDWHPTDEFRNSLTSEQKDFYDRNRSGLQSGITVINNETSDRVMPFYPLFPTLLSITGSILGGDNRVYILTLFSILTVYLFYKITLYLTNKRTVAYLSALFLAINPIHVFFSNFPLTEIIAIGFVFFAIYYIFRYVSEVKQNNNGLISLIFMSGLLMAFYLTRLSFFFYIPILLLLFLILLTFVDTKKRIKEILCFIVTNIVFFVVSTYLYSKFAYNELFFPTFSDLLKSLLGTNYMLFLSLIVFAYTLLITGILLHKINLKPIFKNIFNNLWSLIVLIFVILIIAVFLKNYYDLGYTNLYRGDLINNYGGVFKEANSLQYLFLYVLFNYLSSFLLLFYLIC